MKNRERLFCLFVIVANLAVVSSCSKPEPPQGEPIQFSGGKPTRGAELSFQVPEGWVEEEPSSAMRRTQYRLPGPDPLGGDAELAIFAGIGGSVEQNVNRWINQFEPEGDPRVTKRVINSFQVTLVDVSGTYSAGRMTAGAEAKKNQRMLAAVIETAGTPWFFKLVGPQETVAKWESSFEGYIESVR
jgi:hypothetical protein